MPIFSPHPGVAGDYYRLLADGVYKITATAKGHHPLVKCVEVTNVNNVHNNGKLQEAQIVNFSLTPDDQPAPRDPKNCRKNIKDKVLPSGNKNTDLGLGKGKGRPLSGSNNVRPGKQKGLPLDNSKNVQLDDDLYNKVWC